MSGDDACPVLVDQNMNMVMMGRTDRDDLIQSDRIGKHMQQDLNEGSLKNLTNLKPPLTNGSVDILQSGDAGSSLKETLAGKSKWPLTPGSESDPEDKEDANICESEAEDKHDEASFELKLPYKSLLDEGSFECIQRRVCLVKLYAWIKDEMSKTSARSVASHLYQHEKKLLSHADHESILHCSWRREAVEQLLKKVLMGPYDIDEVFLRALKDQGETHIAAKLVNSHASEKEVELFTTLEKSSLQQCTRPDSHLPRFTISNSDHETLIYYLNNKNTIDSLSDSFLSRFMFSIREHTNICQCSLDCERRVKLYIDTMKQCADSVFKDFCEILSAIEMEHVITKLERRKQGEGGCRQRQKRKVDTSQADTSEEPSTSTAAKRLRVDSSMEHRLVSSMQRSSSTIRLHAIDQFGFDVENVNKGSIVIQLCPKMADSWSRLEENCKSGKIKDFIPVVYNNEAIHDLLQEGEYKLHFTIYTLPVLPDSEEDQKVMFHLETEPEKPKECPQDLENPIEDHMSLLCEELEISKDLLALLRDREMVGANIKAEIDKQGSRAKKIKYLLKEVSKHGKQGYEVLKEHIKEENEDLYKELTTRDEVKVIDTKMDAAAKVNKRSRPAANHRGVFKKEVFFSGTVVLKVKRKGNTPSKENLNPKISQDQFEISCPEIINPVCHFTKDKGKGQSSGEVTMVLEEAWSTVGDKPKPQREILIGKRKKRSISGKEEGSCKRQESQEKQEDQDDTDAGATDLKTEPEQTKKGEASESEKGSKDIHTDREKVKK